ncbi:MAG: glycosyltransferase family 39 protein [Ardenticatenaceae bacterium]|nr:glycosyltransferase family 39 protein [Ardenticatenaceae bacterium]
MVRKNRFTQPHFLLLLAILVIASFLRLYHLSVTPPGINGDELFNAIDASQINWRNLPVFLPGNNGREPLFHYLIAISQAIFGQTIVAMRLPAVLLGLGVVGLGYLLGRDWFNQRSGLLAAALLAISVWPLMESRWALRAVSLTFMTALTLFWLGRGLQRPKQWPPWLLGGFALGLTMYTYIPSRIFPAVVLLWWGWLAWRQRGWLRQTWPQLAVTLLLAAAVFAPLGWYMWQNPDLVNQRVNAFRTTLDEALDGNPAALLPSILGVVKMFTIEGDQEWRYHVAGEPVFDWATGLFFYGGVVWAVFYTFTSRGAGEQGGRGEKAAPLLLCSPAPPLLLLWLAAMLGPNAILEANSSFLRAAGAMVPVYLLTAVFLDHTLTYTTTRWPQTTRLWPLLLTAGFALTLLNTWQQYFVRWANNPDVREIYQADLAAMGRYLNENPPPPNTRVYIGHPRAYDAAPRDFAYHTRRPVSWFVPANGIAWSDQPAWYLLPADEPPPAALTEVATAMPIPYSDGDPAFVRYDTTLWDVEPAAPLQATFANGPTLVGYTLPDELLRGDKLTAVFHFQIPDPAPNLPNSLTYVRTQLLDDSGNVWAESSELLTYPQANWQAGDRFGQTAVLTLPGGMPPGQAQFRIDLHDGDGTLFALSGENRTALLPIRSRPLADFTPPTDALIFDQTLMLQSATFSSLLTPGLDINMALNWVALQRPTTDYALKLQLADPDTGESILEQTFDIWIGRYPTSRWQLHEPVTSLHQFHVPADLVIGVEPVLKVWLLTPEAGVGETAVSITQGSNILATMQLDQRQRLYTPPLISHPLTAQFGDAIQLLGYDLQTDSEALHLTLYWQALATPATNYTVFNHLVDSNGQIIAQLDSPPSGDGWLTATWLPGEIVIDQRTIPLNGVSAGDYTLLLGLYSSSGGERLPVKAEGQPQPDNQLRLVQEVFSP